MFHIKQLRWILSSVLVLTACTSVQKDSSLNGIEIKPVMRVSHTDGSPRIQYLLGRYHQGKLDYQKAIAAYQKALAVKPGYIEVHNGLGVIYSLQGQHELSLRHFYKAIELAPQETYLHNNLGYAHLIRGSFAEAIVSLNKALSLDPENKRAQWNLAIAQEKNSSDDKTVASQSNPNNSLSLVSQKLSKTDADEVGGNITKFREDADSRFITVTPHANNLIANDKNSMLPDNKNIRLEVSNGNGITGMAKQISFFFQQRGVATIRLTNHQPYNQNHTEIYYRAGNYHQAYQINQLLPVPARLIESDKLRNDIQIKILLGRDFSRKAIYLNAKELTQVSQKTVHSSRKES